MIQIVTDSASDITLEEAKKLNIHIVPLTITFEDGTECPQETLEDFEVFYQRLNSCKELPSTSQPSPELYCEIYDRAKEAGDDVLVLTLSGGLSGTVNSATMARNISEYDRVVVVDTRHAITSQRILVEHAVKMRDNGESVTAIAEKITELRDYATVSGVVDTLKFLKKGGRIPASLATVGTALNLKPIIALQDAKLITIGKTIGRNAGKKLLYTRFEKYEPDENYPILFGYTADREFGEAFMKETIEKYNLQSYETKLYSIGGVIGTHVGDKCIAIAYVSKTKICT